MLNKAIETKVYSKCKKTHTEPEAPEANICKVVHGDETAKAFKKIEKLFHAVASISFFSLFFQYD